MNELIREGKVKKYYNALVKGRIKDGLYTGYISKMKMKIYQEFMIKKCQIQRKLLWKLRLFKVMERSHS